MEKLWKGLSDKIKGIHLNGPSSQRIYNTLNVSFEGLDGETLLMNLDLKKVNVNGGAIALGHPLGCSGAKLTVQLLNELKRRNNKYGVVTMCIGTGHGAAGVFELL